MPHGTAGTFRPISCPPIQQNSSVFCKYSDWRIIKSVLTVDSFLLYLVSFLLVKNRSIHYALMWTEISFIKSYQKAQSKISWRPAGFLTILKTRSKDSSMSQRRMAARKSITKSVALAYYSSIVRSHDTEGLGMNQIEETNFINRTLTVIDRPMVLADSDWTMDKMPGWLGLSIFLQPHELEATKPTNNSHDLAMMNTIVDYPQPLPSPGAIESVSQ